MNEIVGTQSVVVVGLGNFILGDEGLGIRALYFLKQRLPDSRISYYDGGTRGLALLPFMQDATHLLILDAVQTEANPGKVVVIEKEDLAHAGRMKFSAHDIGLQELLNLLRFINNGRDMEIVLMGIVPECLDASPELSGVVQNALPDLVNSAETLLKRWLEEKPEIYQEGNICVSEFPEKL